VPVKILGLEIQRESIGENAVQCVGDLRPVSAAEIGRGCESWEDAVVLLMMSS